MDMGTVSSCISPKLDKVGVHMFARTYQRLRSLFRSLVKGRSLVARFLFDLGAPVPTGREPTSVALPVLQMFLNVFQVLVLKGS